MPGAWMCRWCTTRLLSCSLPCSPSFAGVFKRSGASRTTREHKPPESDKSDVHNRGMMYGYARVSTDGQSVEAQVAALRAAGAVNVYREVASGAQTDRAQLRQGLARLAARAGRMGTRVGRAAPQHPRPR